jgi:hypothetical protein
MIVGYGDIPKIILALIKIRAAPLHFRRLDRERKDGHLTQAIDASRTACELPRYHDAIEIEQGSRPTDTLNALEIVKVTAEIANEAGPPDEPARKSGCSAFPFAHRGRDQLAAMRDLNRKKSLDAPTRAIFWKEIKRTADPKPAPMSVTADELKTVFEKRLNPPNILTVEFDSTQHKINKILATLLPEKTEGSSPKVSSRKNGLRLTWAD